MKLEDVIEELRNGKRIRRKEWARHDTHLHDCVLTGCTKPKYYCYLNARKEIFLLDMLAEDWEVMDET